MSCQNTIISLQGTYHSLVRRIRYVLIRQVFWLSFNAMHSLLGLRQWHIAHSSTSQQRSCRRFALRSLFTCTVRTSTCKLPIFCFRGYYSMLGKKCKDVRIRKFNWYTQLTKTHQEQRKNQSFLTGFVARHYVDDTKPFFETRCLSIVILQEYR